MSGSQNGSANASQALQAALANPAGLLQDKITERDGVAAQTNLQVPDSGVQQALLWSKLNLADLNRTIANAAIRDVKAGTVYPAPLATVPQLSAIDAAYPDYAEFFGTDGAYSSYGLAVSGQWQTAANWLNAMRTVSQIENGSTGKVVHEVTATGAVYFGDNSDPGDINETAQFAIAADLTWKWSGDNAVLADNYKFIAAGEHYLASLATGPDHLWPVGDGIVENPSLGGEALDVASETIQALGALHDMAVAMNDNSTAAWAAQRENAMLKAFGQWWIKSQNLYADSMCTAASRRHRLHRGGPAAPAALVDQRRPDGAGHRPGRQRRCRARPNRDAHLHRLVRPVRGRRGRPERHRRPELLPGQHRRPGRG